VALLDSRLTNSVDYWVIRKGNIHTPSVFLGGPQSIYWYWHGFNLRAYAAWLIGVVLVVHGVANSLAPGTLDPASTNIYNMGIILSSLAGGLSYYLICLVFPPPIMPPHHADEPVTWEKMAPTEGYFQDDENVPSYITFTETQSSLDRDSQVEAEDEKMEKDVPLRVVEV
jgi:NCS1 family nucleobase:cation symporter-1